jgi:hypothetical protein
VISLDFTCGCYEAVYVEFEWDIANVSSSSMTSYYLSVNHRNGPSSLHSPGHGDRGTTLEGAIPHEMRLLADHLGLKG